MHRLLFPVRCNEPPVRYAANLPDLWPIEGFSVPDRPLAGGEALISKRDIVTLSARVRAARLPQTSILASLTIRLVPDDVRCIIGQGDLRCFAS
jgi:hypothetical protein